MFQKTVSSGQVSRILRVSAHNIIDDHMMIITDQLNIFRMPLFKKCQKYMTDLTQNPLYQFFYSKCYHETAKKPNNLN